MLVHPVHYLEVLQGGNRFDELQRISPAIFGAYGRLPVLVFAAVKHP